MENIFNTMELSARAYHKVLRLARTIADLSRMRDFVRAYEPDGMKPEEFITFGAVNRTMQQFIESGWNRLKEYRC